MFMQDTMIFYMFLCQESPRVIHQPMRRSQCPMSRISRPCFHLENQELTVKLIRLTVNSWLIWTKTKSLPRCWSHRRASFARVLTVILLKNQELAVQIHTFDCQLLVYLNKKQNHRQLAEATSPHQLWQPPSPWACTGRLTSQPRNTCCVPGMFIVIIPITTMIFIIIINIVTNTD